MVLFYNTIVTGKGHPTEPYVIHEDEDSVLIFKKKEIPLEKLRLMSIKDDVVSVPNVPPPLDDFSCMTGDKDWLFNTDEVISIDYKSVTETSSNRRSPRLKNAKPLKTNSKKKKKAIKKSTKVKTNQKNARSKK